MLEYFKINNHFKKYLPIFMIMLSLVLLMGTSYALLRSSQQGEETYVMNVGLLEVTFQDSETNALTVENMVPVTDEEGQQTDKELVFTVKNTGTLPAKYNIYIEETSTNPEFKTVIRFISNKNNTGYNSPKTLSENNFIDTMATLDVGESATYKVKCWLDESADSTYMDKTFTARVVVDVIQGNAPAMAEIQRSIAKSTCNPSVTDDDGTIYLSGTKDCVNFNYVWYSGKLWRITALYPDGTMKMITDGMITSIAFGESNKFYTDENTTSYMYQWLNQEFLPTLYNYESIIVEDAVWNASPGNGTLSSKLPIEGQEEVLVNASVGLLNSYEYYKSYQNTSDLSGYLNIGDYWWLLNPYNASSSKLWYIFINSSHGGNSPSKAYGVRPSINLKSSIQLAGGVGTASDPYRIKGDKEDGAADATLLNTRTSGEYVNINNEIFRIVGTETIEEKLTTKLNKVDSIKDINDVEIIKKFASTGTFGLFTNTQTDVYWDYYLNNTWLKGFDRTYSETEGTSSMLVKGIYYTKYFTGGNYKGTACAIVNNITSIKDCDKTGAATWTGYVGLPRFGEMFSSANSWLITPFSSSGVWNVYGSGEAVSESLDNLRSVYPSIHLKSTIVIKSGSGTEQDPFVVGLPSSE